MAEPRVLLVDDEEQFVRTLAERLEMRAFRTLVALSGEEALEIVDRELPDVMVLDLNMPGIDGMEVLRRVCMDYPQIQVIISTGHGSERDERVARCIGAFEYLNKPVAIQELVEVIRRASRLKGPAKREERDCLDV
jgi:DNA-binding response OmpR family regulator